MLGYLELETGKCTDQIQTVPRHRHQSCWESDGTVRLWKMALPGLKNEPYNLEGSPVQNANWTQRDNYRYVNSPDGKQEFRVKGDLLLSTDFNSGSDSLSFNHDSTRIIDHRPDGTTKQLVLPLLRSSREQMQAILELQCGEAIDENGGTSEMGVQNFQRNRKFHLPLNQDLGQLA